MKKPCPIVWVILQKEFLYLHQHGSFCPIVWLFMMKKFLYYFVSICYIYRRNGMKNLCPIVLVFMKKECLYLYQHSASLSGCLDYFEEKVFILLYFYMLYLSQEQYELYKIYIIKKSFCQKSQTIGQHINCKRYMNLKRVFIKKARHSDKA